MGNLLHVSHMSIKLLKKKKTQLCPGLDYVKHI